MSLSAQAPSEAPVTFLAYLDVVVLVVAAPIMLLIGVPAVGYAVAAGVWIALRAVGVGVDRLARAAGHQARELSIRMGFLLGRLFLLALTVILVRQDAGKNAGLTALLVIVFAYTFSMILSVFTRAWSR
jgi:hypothetical protein